MDLKADDIRGKQAAALLRDPLLIEAFAILEENYLHAWRATAVGAADVRERIWVALKILATVQAHLRGVIEGGHLAAAELAEEVAHAA